MKIGYARVSSMGQDLTTQIEMLKERGAERIFAEKMTGTTDKRPELEKMLMTLRSGDQLIIYSFSRLSRSTKSLLEMVEKLNAMNVELISIKEQLDTTTATGKMMLTMLSALSQFERDLIAERTKDALKVARARGRMGGRPKKATEEMKRKALALYDANTMTNKEIANFANVSMATLGKWIKEHKEGK